MKSSPL